MAEYCKSYEAEGATPAPAKKAVGNAPGSAAAQSSRLKPAIDQASHLKLSATAVFGWVVGGFMFFQGITLSSAQTSIHQIYQLLCFGQGGLLIVAGGIAQHTKGLKRNL